MVSNQSLSPTELGRLSQDQLDEHCAPLVRDNEEGKDSFSRGGHQYAYRVISNLIVPKIIEIAQYHCLSSYHHVLKTHWLGGKRNRFADHLVHTLVMDMLPDYEICCDRQVHDFDGADLARKRRKEIVK
jgi:hypothetical protein